MYKFIDVNEHQPQSSHLPSEALFINGKAIEEEINGYRTLTVSGRELLGQDLNTVRRNTGDGSIFLGATYPPRTITIQYELKADDNEDYRLKFERLNRLLAGGEKELRFNDDYDYHFTGVLEGVDEVSSGRNTVIGSFSFFCADPFKYSDLQIMRGNSPSLVYDDTFPIIPDYITVELSGDTDDFLLTSGDKQIKILNFSFMLGEEIIFDFVNNQINNRYGSGDWYILEYLSLDSNFEDFYIMSGVPVRFSSSATIEVGYRRKAL